MTLSTPSYLVTSATPFSGYLFTIFFFIGLYVLLLTRGIDFRKTKKFFLPSLIAFIVMCSPQFSAYNLWNIECLPQVSIYNYSLIDGEEYSPISFIYNSSLPFLAPLFSWTCIGIFLSYIRNKRRLKVYEEVLLFIPFINLYLISKAIINKRNKTIAQLMMVLFLITSFIHWYYVIIAPVLFLNNIDTYSWYVSLFYEDWNIGTAERNEFSSYTLATDLIQHMSATTPYILALFSLLVYFVQDKFCLKKN